MTDVTLTVNGTIRRASVEPRTSLADYLRDDLRLTGTHLGCEQGVCGACTIVVGGRPVRSCLAFAAACDGADVRTIEGLDSDATMVELRAAFTAEHALQCGFCTPAMLITARDIVQRLPHADDRRVRLELGGNLCRCTGYVGIVRAIRKVLDAHAATRPGAPELPQAAEMARDVRHNTPLPVVSPMPSASSSPPSAKESQPGGGVEIRESFEIHRPREHVWSLFADLRRVTSCVPGAELLEQAGESFKGRIKVKLGPIVANFIGDADLHLDPSSHSGDVSGRGADSGNGSRAQGKMAFTLSSIDATSTKVDATITYSLTGSLAQFGRPGIVRAVVQRLMQDFARAVEDDLAGGAANEGRKPARTELNAISLAVSIFRSEIRSLFSRFTRLFRRK
ncbi:MAG TPA: 2Fe-2S iron-sulfur cluster-binding protein [Bauldia sp.]|nr:2Fe-2S iron-sulfur cluster-binding protein [Bauldia sp.]